MDNVGMINSSPMAHRHDFLGAGHARNERRTWAVVILCTMMMMLEIIGGTAFHSLALVADGWHMSTHAGALLLAALAYRYARRHSDDPRFVFGTGKLGDLAAYTSAIILAMIAVLIGYEAVVRILAPVHIDLSAALPIACLGLAVNLISAWLLSGDHDHAGGHHRHHNHEASAGGGNAASSVHTVTTPWGSCDLQIFEEGAPPRFRLNPSLPDCEASVEIIRPDGSKQSFPLRPAGTFMQSIDEIPEPHEFTAQILLTNGAAKYVADVPFVEHTHHHAAGAVSRDNNIRAAFVHVFADGAVSLLVICGLLTVKFLGWVWMDPVMGIVGALVIASWSLGLVRSTVGILVDMTPDEQLGGRIRSELEQSGDKLLDLHLWRVGPGHLSAIISLATSKPQPLSQYQAQLARVAPLSHVTIEVHPV